MTYNKSSSKLTIMITLKVRTYLKKHTIGPPVSLFKLKCNVSSVMLCLSCSGFGPKVLPTPQPVGVATPRPHYELSFLLVQFSL